MSIDFRKVMVALKKVKYNGYLTLEADQYLRGRNQENIFDGIKNMAAAARYLRDMELNYES